MYYKQREECDDAIRHPTAVRQ